MDLAALRTRARLISGVEMTSLRSDAEVDDVLNDVYTELLAQEKWRFLSAVDSIPTVAGTSTYDLTNVAEVQSVTLEDADTNGPIPLREVSQRWVDRYIDHGEVSDRDEPTVYARLDGQILLAPTPDAVYTVQVRGFTSPPPLAADADEPVFAERFHPVLAHAAGALLAGEEGQFEREERALNRAASLLNAMRKHYVESADDEPVRMGGGTLQFRETAGKIWPWRR